MQRFEVSRSKRQPNGIAGITTKADVAGLFRSSIQSMPRDELLDAIVAGRLPLLDESQLKRLENADRRTLERLARLARSSCRRQGY